MTNEKLNKCGDGLFPARSFPDSLKEGAVVVNDFFFGENSPILGDWKITENSERGVSIRADGLSFETPPQAARKECLVRREIPIDALKGHTLYASARVRVRDVSAKPKPWNGVVFRAGLLGKNGEMNSGGGLANVEDLSFPQANIASGSFDWKEVGFLFTVPRDTISATLTMGLEGVAGKATFRDIRVAVVKVAEPPPSPDTVTPRYFKGHPLDRLRGVEVSCAVSEEDLRVLAEEWKANVIRWQLGESTFADGLETSHYDDVLRRELLQLDRVIPLCRKYGLYIVLNLQSLSKRLFVSKENQQRLVGVWKKLAARYKNEPVIYAYDIANEPLQSSWREGALLWNDLAQKVAEEIRKVDLDRPIIVESELMSLPDGYLTLRLIAVPNVIYSVHVYSPGDLTHNRVWDHDQQSVPYPGMIEKELWNKDRIRQDLVPVVAFQKEHKCHIYVGEFGAVRWAPGSDQYIKEMIELFEEYGWDWTYHSYREWHGWSAEHGQQFQTDEENIEQSPAQTEREKVLRGWFAKNERPKFSRE